MEFLPRITPQISASIVKRDKGYTEETCHWIHGFSTGHKFHGLVIPKKSKAAHYRNPKQAYKISKPITLLPQMRRTLQQQYLMEKSLWLKSSMSSSCPCWTTKKIQVHHPTQWQKQDKKTKTVIGMGKRHDGLYFITNRQPSSPTQVSLTRLGHTSHQRLKSIISLLLNSFTPELVCDQCVFRKQSKLPFSRSFISTTMCFQLLHLDIWGKFHITWS